MVSQGEYKVGRFSLEFFRNATASRTAGPLQQGSACAELQQRKASEIVPVSECLIHHSFLCDSSVHPFLNCNCTAELG